MNKKMTTHILGDSVPRKSNYDPDLARKVTKYYEEHPEALIEKKEEPKNPASYPIGKYVMMPQTDTYAINLHALQDECIQENNQNHPRFKLPGGRTVYRPLTIKENCLARLKQFYTDKNPDGSTRTLGQRVEFMDNWNDSCCGIAYPVKKSQSSKFKLILQCPELISLPVDFKNEFYSVDYTQLPCTRELDRRWAKYDQNLYPTEIDTHEGWLTLFEEDLTALRDYRQAVGEALTLKYAHNSPRVFMAFWLLNTPKEDQLRAVYVSSLDGDSHVSSVDHLNNYGRFLRHKP